MRLIHVNRFFPIWLLCLAALVGSGRAQSIELTRTRIPGGGGSSAGGQFSLFSTVGQAEAGSRLAGGVYEVNTGFLSAAMASSVPEVVFAQLVVTVNEDAGAQSRATFATYLPGPAAEPAQPPAYRVSSSAPALFSTGPSIGTDRTLGFTPAADAHGSSTVTVVVLADGVDVATNTFTIVVTPVNDAPGVAFAPNPVTVLEDAGAQSIAGFATFNPGAVNEAAQTGAYLVSVDNPPLFSVAPAISAAGVLTFTPAANANGTATTTVIVQDNGGTANGGVDRSTNTFTIAVTAVNDMPGVTLARATVTVLEDAGGQSLAGFAAFTSGPVDESGQTASYAVSADNAALFSVAPAISSAGMLTFTSAANANGTAMVTVIAQDSGGSANGGRDKTTNTFAIVVTAVNDAPSVAFAQGTVTVLEDAGSQSFASFATFTAGPTDEAGQAGSFAVSTDNAGLFSVAPAISGAGGLTFTAATNANGSATVTVVAQDNGGTANGGVDKATNTFVIAVTPVNDPPSLSFAQSTVTVLEDAGAQTLAGFSTFTAGPADEAGQTATYAVTVDNAGLFGTAPSLSSAGVLSFKPATNANGTATVTVVVQDSGGAANGGVDKRTNTFAIVVTPVNDVPGVAFALSRVVAVQGAGPQTFANFASFTAGPADEAAQTAVYTLAADNTGLFTVPPALSPDGRLTFTPAALVEGETTVTVVLRDSGGTSNGGHDQSTNTFTLAVVAFSTMADNYAVSEDGSLVVAANSGVLANDVGAGLGARLATAAAHGVVTLRGDGSFNYAPTSHFNGTDIFAYQATNSALTSAVTTVTITVTPVNDAPSVAYLTNAVVVLEDAGAQSFPSFATFNPGPTNEVAQGLVGYTVGNSSNALFSVQPAIGNDGTLTFTAATNANGSATVTVVVQDSGGTANGGVDRSTNTFVIAVTPVNDAPSVVLAQGTVTVLEDAGAQSMGSFTSFTAGPTDEAGQAPSYMLTVDNAALFSVAPAISGAGVLTFTPATNVNGSATVTVVVQDSGGTANGGVDKRTNTFAIMITPVNDAPGVTFAQNPLTVLEDSGANTIASFAAFSAGPANESAQALAGYTITVNNLALFSAAPAINSAGVLTFTPAPNANGNATVTVVVQDNAGVADGGVDKSTNTFAIMVTAVNDMPSVVLAQGTVTVLEDAGAQSMASFTSFTAGPSDETGQIASYTLTSDNAALFSVAPAISGAGVLTFTPATNANGSATVTVVVQDSGGTANGGADKRTNTFAIVVTAVNDAPSVAFSTNQVVVVQDTGRHFITNFAVFTAGPANESGQVGSYSLAVDNAALFAEPPALTSDGTLAFELAAGVNGSAAVTVIAQDDGGTSNGGKDRTTNSFTLTLVAFSTAADSYSMSEDGLLSVAASVGVLANDIGMGLGARLAAAASHGTVTLGADGSFVYLPDGQFFGSDTFSYQVTNSTVTSGVTVVTISVLPVNDAPSMALAQGTMTVLEDAGGQTVAGFAAFTPGPANEAAQTAAYVLTVDNAALFSVAPAISGAGVLTFTAAANANGSAVVTVVVQDSGGTANGGVDKRTNTFAITVMPVNDAPAVTLAGHVTVLEDAGPQMRGGFVTSFVPGPADEVGQVPAHQVAHDNPLLFSVPPVIAPDGTLTFTPATNVIGAATVTVITSDGGGTANSGRDRTTNTFLVTVTPVNDAPGVTFAQGTVTVLEDAGAQSVSGFATFSPGPANEFSQALVGYTVTVDNPALFSAVPAIASDGSLAFTSATNANGSATVTVVVQDSGGTANGGVDKATNTFAILMAAINDAPMANHDSYTVNQGDELVVIEPGLLINDTDVESHSLTAIKLTSPAHGTIVFNANGGFTYRPDVSFHGVDTFTYRAADASSNSSPTTVSLSVSARPMITAPPGRQRVFSSAALRFSATNAPDINAIRVTDPDSSELTLTLTVTNGTLAVTVTNGLTFANGFASTNALVLAGPIVSLNAALESLAYLSTTNYFGDDTLVIVAQDEGGRTNRGNGALSILVEIPARGAALQVPLAGLNNPGTGRMITNATAVALDTNVVEGISYDPTNNVVNVLPVAGQDGSTNRSSVTVLAYFSDGSTQLVTVPVIVYQPLLTATTNLGTYDSTFGVPIFNPQTSLYEQKVSVVNKTPFSFTALRLTATNLPPTVMLQNATITNGGRAYIDYNLTIRSGSNVTLKVEYFSSDLQPFTPGLKLELLNQQRTNTAPAAAAMSAVFAQRNGYNADRVAKNSLRIPTLSGRLYYVQYQDAIVGPWKTSPVVVTGTGQTYNWIDDGPPNTETAPGPVRFYRVVTEP